MASVTAIRYRASVMPGATMSILTSTTCAACTECAVNPALIGSHALMIRQTMQGPTHTDSSTEHYRCLECESNWVLHSDGNGLSGCITKTSDDSCLPGPAFLDVKVTPHRLPARQSS